MDNRFSTAIARIDAANAEDPHRITDGSASQPATLLYGCRMTHWLRELYPDASEALQLAARAQHIRRWKIARNSYPMDRAGYHRWRTALYSFHADQAAAILQEIGYDEITIARVKSLLRKEKLKTDSQMQALEDVICLVFLETEFAGFATRQDEAKMIGILRRTWAKMSPLGHAAALKIPLQPDARKLIEKALSPG